MVKFRAYLNFTLLQFENCFRGCLSVFTRMIAGYLTSKNGKTDRKQTQNKADKTDLLGNLNRLLLPPKI